MTGDDIDAAGSNVGGDKYAGLAVAPGACKALNSPPEQKRPKVERCGTSNRSSGSRGRCVLSADFLRPMPLEPRFAIYLFLSLADESRSRRQQ